MNWNQVLNTYIFPFWHWERVRERIVWTSARASCSISITFSFSGTEYFNDYENKMHTYSFIKINLYVGVCTYASKHIQNCAK